MLSTKGAIHAVSFAAHNAVRAARVGRFADECVANVARQIVVSAFAADGPDIRGHERAAVDCNGIESIASSIVVPTIEIPVEASSQHELPLFSPLLSHDTSDKTMGTIGFAAGA